MNSSALTPDLHARLSRLVREHDQLVSRAEDRTGPAWQRLADRVFDIEGRIGAMAVRAGIGLHPAEFRDDRTIIVVGQRAIILERSGEHRRAGKGPVFYISVVEALGATPTPAGPPSAAPTPPAKV